MLEHRSLDLAAAEVKFSGDKAGSFTGYASVFGGLDSYGDTILPGAYADTIKARRPLMLYGHNPGRVIGKWVEIVEDSKGLLVRGEFTPGHSDAQDVYASLKHGALNGLSIGFRVPEGGAEMAEERRLLKKIDLFEISVVSMPADDAARVGDVKSAIEALVNIKDFEAFLRRDDAGPLSKSQAKTFVAGLAAALRRDDGEGEPARLKARIADLEGRLLADAFGSFTIPKSLKG